MTGPRTCTVHPYLNRGARLRLPLLAALVLSPLGCTSDQPMGPETPESVPLAASTRQHPYSLHKSSALATSSRAMAMSQASRTTAANVTDAGPNVLVLADTNSPTTTALAQSLVDAGFHVGVMRNREYNWFGSNPSLDGYEVVIHLNGSTFNLPLSSSAQSALNGFVMNGGGFVGAQWNGYEEQAAQQTEMPDLVLHGVSDPLGGNCADCDVTYSTVPGQEGHPVLEGLSSSFTFRADGQDASPKAALAGDPATQVLMTVPEGGPGVIVRQVGGGKVVGLSLAANYAFGGELTTLYDANIQRLYINSARWLSGSNPVAGSGSLDSDADGLADGSDNCAIDYNPDQLNLDGDGMGDLCDPDDDGDGVLDGEDNCPEIANADQADADGDWIGDACDGTGTTPQTISFDPLADKTYGDQPFTVSATASSGLPVHFLASGDCTISDATVTITAAGTCTIFAQQPGNDEYSPAQTVVRSFAIAKAPQSIDFAALPDQTVGAPPFSVDATASSGLPVSFTAAGQCTLSGSTVTMTSAGSCTITAQQAGNSNYLAASDVAREFNINKLAATILLVAPSSTFDGTAKQASATTDPAGLSGLSVTYTLAGLPVSQPVNAGTYQVTATLDNPNYEASPATAVLTIGQAQPVLHWADPAAIPAGTPLGAAQLNASATGIGGISLTGTFVYLPTAGTVLGVGSHPLSVEFFPGDANYARAIKTVSLTVLPRSYLRFSGFFGPVYNLPYANRMRAGRSVPMIFAVQGSTGGTVLKESSLTSTEVSCKKTTTERLVKETGNEENSKLRARGNRFTYVWKTSADWAGTCRSFVVKLEDGSKHEALFHFTGKPKPVSQPSGRGGSRSWNFRDRGVSR